MEVEQKICLNNIPCFYIVDLNKNKNYKVEEITKHIQTLLENDI